jgi:NAD-dependent oxidoreductase involved in siderophore biosynthesis
MRFIIIYNNRDDVRNNIEILIRQLVGQGFNCAINQINHPLFSSRLFWPSQQEIAGLPFTTQCEEVIWTENKLTSLRKLIIDVETEVVPVVRVEEPIPEEKTA